ncbi:MAG: D-alanyl-D-alanine carboxypeptidase family protein, partial [Acidobacteria bacterium]|nr:D-alanyl-D-alanine carboxypeptidase family protein [Acidobacteriota bacterium]
ELVHTLQQVPVSSLPGRLEVGRPESADERQAEVHSRQALAGGAAGQAPGSAPPRLQRKALAKVKESQKPGAGVCLVHLHGDEQNALAAASTLHKERCSNFVYLEPTGKPKRHVPVEATVGSTTFTCSSVDPNRIFANATVDDFAKGCSKAAPTAQQPAAETAFKKEIDDFRTELSQAISRGRGGAGTKDLAGSLPVVVFHNNTPGDENKITSANPFGGTSITKYERIAAAAKKDPKVSEKQGFKGDTSTLARAKSNPLTDPNNFVYVTDRSKDKALATDLNVVFQDPGLKGTAGDDGSLSIALESERYVNVEAAGKPLSAAQLATNLDMGNKVLDHLGVAKEPCKAPSPPSSGGLVSGVQAALRQIGEKMAAAAARVAQEKARVAAARATLPPALPRDAALPKAVEKKVKAGSCTTFADQKALDTAKADRATKVAAMPTADAVDWVIGVAKPPKWVSDEVSDQKSCLEAGLKAAAAVSGSGITLPKKLSQTPLRTFKDQEKIWNEKFTFTRGGKWGRITPQARRQCTALIRDDEVEWNSKSKKHEHCFKNLLTDDERQVEILQTSSAPGISRHHLGTDFDFDNTNPADWEAGKTGAKGFADEYGWLQRNASTYGFMQPFTVDSNFNRLGYIEERWHWSYYPIAQAVLEWSKKHVADIEADLKASDWKKNPARFTFIQAHFKEFMFNVNETPQF